MEKEIYKFCLKEYNKAYKAIKRREEKNAKDRRTGEIATTKAEKIEKLSQLGAIKQTIIEGRKKYPKQVHLLWHCIYKAHLFRKSGIDNPEVVARAISAEQSWRSSSGHAFEEMIKELGTLALYGTNIKYILQRDLNVLLKANELANQPTEIAWLEKQVGGQVFDLYVIADYDKINETTKAIETKTICFGCVQCKTSIRDRVSRDVVPSKEAMTSKFWSIGFVLDGEMFSVPKYKNMVNGNPSSEFKKNGWHGMYVLSECDNNDRIYGVDLNFEIIRNHTIKAYDVWKNDRMGFSEDWRAE